MGHARESEVARGTVRCAEGETERWMPDGLGLLRLCLTRDRLDRDGREEKGDVVSRKHEPTLPPWPPPAIRQLT